MTSPPPHSLPTEPPVAQAGRGSGAAGPKPAARWHLQAVGQEVRWLLGSRAFLGLVAVFLAADAILVVFHILHVLKTMEVFAGGAFLDSRLFLISEDRGYGEIWGYVKSLAIVAAFLACYAEARQPLFAALGFTFAVIVLDDSLMLHEVFGHRVSAALALEPVLGLKAQDQGELLVWSVLGTAVVAALAVGFRRSGRHARTVGSIFLGLFAALIFFAVVVDMLHILLNDAFRGAYRIFPLVEEGGELAVLSLTCAAAVALRSRRAR